MSSSNQERLWTAKDVAEYLRVKEDMVLSWVREGLLPTIDIFGEQRFEPAEVKEKIRGENSSANFGREQLQLISLSELCKALGVHRTTIFRRVRDDRFPKPVLIGKRRKAWRIVDIQEWIAERMQP